MEWAIIPPIVAVVVVIVVLAIRHESEKGRRRLEIWRRFATERGYRWLEPSGPWYRRTPHAVEGTSEGVPFRLDTFVVSTGKSHVTFTRVRGSLERALPAKLSVSRRCFLTPASEFLGLKCLRTGDRVFDEAMCARSKEHGAALRVLDEEVRARAADLGRGGSLEVKGKEAKVWWLGAEADPARLETGCRVLTSLVRACAKS